MSRSSHTGVVAALLLALPAGGAAAQTVRSGAIDAGDVATVVLQLPAAGADSAVYRLELEPGFRPFVAAEGLVARHSDDTFVLPITFATPRRLPAGHISAGRLQVTIDGREPIRREVVVRVRERREFAFHLEADESRVAPDGLARVAYRVHNLGNRADTLHLTAAADAGWSLLEAPRVVVEPGDSVLGALQISAPGSVSPGDRQLIAVTARSGDRDVTRTVNIVVVSPTGWLGGLAHVPSSIFLGQALGEMPATVAALSGSGRVAPDTDVRIDMRYSEAGIVDPALQRQLAGARFRVSVSRPDLRAAVGDVYTPRTTLTGSLRQAMGLEAEVDPAGPLSGGLFVAVPSGLTGGVRGGHIVQARGGVETRYGQVGVLVGDMALPDVGQATATRSTGAGLRWSHVYGPHSGSAEATFVRLAADTVERTGPAVELGYRLQTPKVTGDVRLRRVPGAATAGGGLGNEASASLSAEIMPAIHAVAWAFGSEQEGLGTGSRSESFTASLGLRGRMRSLQGQIGGRLTRRSTEFPLDDGGVSAFGFERRTLRGEASLIRGPFSLDADAETGVSREMGLDGTYTAVGSGIRWYGNGRAAWARIGHSVRPGGLGATTIQTGGRLEVGTVALSGGYNTSLSGTVTTSSLWSATEVDIARNLTLQIGASARPSLEWGDWSFSLGIRRRLNLPLPMARHPDIHGIVFDDANGNGRLDAGERGLEGVALALGYLEETTDEQGTFAFRDATGMPVRIRPDRLPLGYIVPPGLVLPTRGRTDIPLVRTATLHLDLFLDRDEDGRRDVAESVGTGVLVTLTDLRGRQRTATADEAGQVRISGLPPGTWVITAVPPSDRRTTGDPEVLMEVEIAPGAELHHSLAVPLRRRTIRMGG